MDDSANQEIPLNYFSNGDCSFELAISSAGDSHTVPLTFTFDQPTFTYLYAPDTTIVDSTISEGILVFLASPDTYGLHTSLEVTMVGYTTPSYTFSIEIVPPDCTNPTFFTLPDFDSIYTVQ